MVFLDLYTESHLISYSNNDLILTFEVSSKLEEILRVKEFDMGYVVFDARYTTGVVEEYLDLEDALADLRLLKLRNNYFRGIGVEDICVRNH